MIDIEQIHSNKDEVLERISKRADVDFDSILSLDNIRKQIISEIELLRKNSNAIADKGPSISEKDKGEGKLLKEKIKVKESELENVQKQLEDRLNLVPNLPLSDVPEGVEGEIIKEWGEVKQVTFAPKDHIEISDMLDLIDFEAGAKVSGSQFYFLKNEAALIEIALISFGINLLSKKGFIPILTPDLVRERYYKGTGFQPGGPEAQIYEVKDEDLGLIATAEVSMAGYHADEIFDTIDLPKKYAALSHCFRKEAGAYGKYSKGLYRVHQFTKVEMFAYTQPENSEDMHQEFLACEEEIFQKLQIPYRVRLLGARDMGTQSAKTYDLEAWMPGRGEWGEITSTSNTTDFQARNMNIKVRSQNGNQYVHMLNGTAIAVSRALIAILENYQRDDGGIDIPEVLHPYLPIKSIEPKNA